MDQPILTVFVDANVMKLASETDVLIRRQDTIDWGGKKLEITVHDFGVRKEVDLLREGEQKREAMLLRKVAEEAASGAIRLITQSEVVDELATLPWARGARLYDVPIEWVDAPVEYSRIIGRVVPSAPSERRNDWKESMVEFMLDLDFPRYKQLQLACGANQGQTINEDQLIDAFHVWCAEGAGATHFLTLDFALIKTVRQHRRYPPRVKLAKPSELLYDLWSARST
jgi:hypothetical protein